MQPGLAERLERNLVRMPNGCLEWTGNRDQHGYGRIKFDGQMRGTHRAAWVVTHGTIPDGQCVLHHCDNPPCCDTDTHLFLGTRADNNTDRASKGRTVGSMGLHNSAKTHCPQGHEYSESNTYNNPGGGRHCRICMSAQNRINKQKGR